jgi:hypothetical protein
MGRDTSAVNSPETRAEGAMLSETRHKCEDCGMRKRAEAKPNSLMARIWRWHTGWCPGWKAYQRSLPENQS